MGLREGGHVCLVRGGAWRMRWFWNSLGPNWISCLLSKCHCPSLENGCGYGFPGVATKESGELRKREMRPGQMLGRKSEQETSLLFFLYLFLRGFRVLPDWPWNPTLGLVVG